MSISADITLAANTWVDLGVAAGIATWTNTAIQNKSGNRINVATTASAPATTDEGFVLTPCGQVGSILDVPAAAVTKVWVRARGTDAKVVVLVK